MSNITQAVRTVLIVGGGTAGWLSATILASKHFRKEGGGLKIKLVEAPDIPIIGVGEGTWPGMRQTLRNAGIKEVDFLRECQASYKQGSKFVGWHGQPDKFYYHPFDLPEGFGSGNVAQHWLESERQGSFSASVCVQEHICEQHLSPKLMSSPEYAGVSNYGYHLDAGKFSEFLKKHCVEKLGVELIVDTVVHVDVLECGNIGSVKTKHSGELSADLFIDCTGFRALLLGDALGVEFVDMSASMPIDSALAVQIPYTSGMPVKSATISTAQSAGWVWDIGLSNRRGVGHVYSSNHISDDQAAVQLQRYLGLSEVEFSAFNPRKLAIQPGYREKFWHRNCVAVGLSAGFLEPLEASAMMVIEASANFIADHMPVTRNAMEGVSKRFNTRFHYRWQRIIDFLKLHYVLSDRKEPFWRDSASTDTMSSRLAEDISLWACQSPSSREFTSSDEAFPIASYQYVLYGMGFETGNRPLGISTQEQNMMTEVASAVSRNKDLLLTKLVPNRKLLDLINA